MYNTEKRTSLADAERCLREMIDAILSKPDGEETYIRAGVNAGVLNKEQAQQILNLDPEARSEKVREIAESGIAPTLSMLKGK